MTQKGKQISVIPEWYKCFEKRIKKMGNAILEPLSNHNCGKYETTYFVHLADIILMYQRCAKSHQKYVAIGNVHGSLSDFATG